MRPKIIIDANIPFIKGFLEPVADVLYLSAADMTCEAVHDADCLIIRTRTRCNESLLANSSVRFIATATIGYDHIDTDYCSNNGISWINAPGCNASSVAQYFAAAIACWAESRKVELTSLTLGIVGVGHVGSEVLRVAQVMGMRCLLCDPPRAVRENDSIRFVSLRDIAEQSDIITFHTPLIRKGDNITYHLASSSFFEHLKRNQVIINAARGGVVDENALLDAIDRAVVSDCIIDCWEKEPDINLALLKRSYIATPHIAGYSADGKANATRMVLEAVNEHFSLGLNLSAYSPLPERRYAYELDSNVINQMSLAYDIMRDDAALRKNPDMFEYFRSNYPIRREVIY